MGGINRKDPSVDQHLTFFFQNISFFINSVLEIYCSSCLFRRECFSVSTLQSYLISYINSVQKFYKYIFKKCNICCELGGHAVHLTPKIKSIYKVCVGVGKYYAKLHCTFNFKKIKLLCFVKYFHLFFHELFV